MKEREGSLQVVLISARSPKGKYNVVWANYTNLGDAQNGLASGQTIIPENSIG